MTQRLGISATGMRAAPRRAGSLRAVAAGVPSEQRITDHRPHVLSRFDQDMRHTLANRMRHERGVIAPGGRRRTFCEIQSP